MLQYFLYRSLDFAIQSVIFRTVGNTASLKGKTQSLSARLPDYNGI